MKITEFSKFIRDLVISLKAVNVLQVGWGTGDALVAFPENFDVSGLDSDDENLEKAKANYGSFEFKKGAITELPYDDDLFDFVFTHKVFNNANDADIPKIMNELLRVSRKYIVNFELYDADEKTVDKITKRNMFKRWSDFPVRIISHVDMHEEIDPEQSRFNLIKKL